MMLSILTIALGVAGADAFDKRQLGEAIFWTGSAVVLLVMMCLTSGGAAQ